MASTIRQCAISKCGFNTVCCYGQLEENEWLSALRERVDEPRSQKQVIAIEHERLAWRDVEVGFGKVRLEHTFLQTFPHPVSRTRPPPFFNPSRAPPGGVFLSTRMTARLRQS